MFYKINVINYINKKAYIIHMDKDIMDILLLRIKCIEYFQDIQPMVYYLMNKINILKMEYQLDKIVYNKLMGYIIIKVINMIIRLIVYKKIKQYFKMVYYYMEIYSVVGVIIIANN